MRWYAETRCDAERKSYVEWGYRSQLRYGRGNGDRCGHLSFYQFRQYRLRRPRQFEAPFASRREVGLLEIEKVILDHEADLLEQTPIDKERRPRNISHFPFDLADRGEGAQVESHSNVPPPAGDPAIGRPSEALNPPWL